MTERQEYYEYFADSSPRWYVKTPPARDADFERALKKFSGGILRVRWAGTLRDKTGSLKYKKIWSGLSGFEYRDDAENLVLVKTEREVPEDKLALPVYARIELGRLRWVIEQFDPKVGDWVAYFNIETRDRQFKDLDMEVLNAVEQMWRYNRETSEEQKQKDDKIREIQKNIEAREEARKEWHRELTAEDFEAAEEEARREQEFFIEAERQSHTLIFS